MPCNQRSTNKILVPVPCRVKNKMAFTLTDRAKRLGTNLINIPCHIFLVVRLHEQISSLTIFPCQGKANMLAFPCQGKIVHFTPSTRAIFPCQGKLVKEKLLV